MNIYVYLDLELARRNPKGVKIAHLEGELVVYNANAVARSKEDAINTFLKRGFPPPVYGLFLYNFSVESRKLTNEEINILF